MNSTGLSAALASVATLLCALETVTANAATYNFDVDASSGIGAGSFSIDLPDAWPGHIGQQTIVPARSFHGFKAAGVPWTALAVSLNEQLEHPNNAVLFGTSSDSTDFRVPSGGVGITPADALQALPGVALRSIGVEAGGVSPVVACPAPATVECADAAGQATLAAEVHDGDGDALEVIWAVDGVRYQTNHVAAGAPPTQAVVPFTASFGFGPHEIVVTVSDGASPSVSCSTTLTVQDTTPPSVQSAWASPAVLWPPDHRLVPVHVSVQATDSCGAVTSKIIAVRSNEAVPGKGKGNGKGKSDPAPDWVVTGDLALNLRADRTGPGSGRVYTITIESRDAAGNRTTRDVTVTVPHDLRKRVVSPLLRASDR